MRRLKGNTGRANRPRHDGRGFRNLGTGFALGAIVARLEAARAQLVSSGVDWSGLELMGLKQTGAPERWMASRTWVARFLGVMLPLVGGLGVSLGWFVQARGAGQRGGH